MNAHKFTAAADAKTTCAECGKTRNAKPHKDYTAAARRAEQDRRESEITAEDIAEPEEFASDIAASAGESVDPAGVNDNDEPVEDLIGEPAEKAEDAPAPSRGRRIPADTAASFWVGWRVAEAGVAAGGSLGDKLGAAKPTQLKYRRVHLTRDEIVALDALAAEQEGPGYDGYARRAARTLRIETTKALEESK